MPYRLKEFSSERMLIIKQDDSSGIPRYIGIERRVSYCCPCKQAEKIARQKPGGWRLLGHARTLEVEKVPFLSQFFSIHQSPPFSEESVETSALHQFNRFHRFHRYSFFPAPQVGSSVLSTRIKIQVIFQRPPFSSSTLNSQLGGLVRSILPTP